MKCEVFLVFLVCVFLVYNCVGIDEGWGRRNFFVIVDDIYEVFIKIVEGEFYIKV